MDPVDSNSAKEQAKKNLNKIWIARTDNCIHLYQLEIASNNFLFQCYNTFLLHLLLGRGKHSKQFTGFANDLQKLKTIIFRLLLLQCWARPILSSTMNNKKNKRLSDQQDERFPARCRAQSRCHPRAHEPQQSPPRSQQRTCFMKLLADIPSHSLSGLTRERGRGERHLFFFPRPQTW